MPKRMCLFFGNKGRGQQRVITNPKQKREVEKRDTQYARNKININHAHAIRRSGIYSDRHVRKNENNMNQKMHHEKKLTCKAHESEPSNATSEMTRLNNAAVSSFFVVCLNALIIRGDEWIGHVFRLEELLVLDIWIWFPKRPHTLVTFQAAPCLQLL